MLGPQTTVTVRVTGTVTVPLHLDSLKNLEDPSLQDEIMREAVRLTVAEKLGGFDNITVTSTLKNGQPVCEARLDMVDLCSLIANVKRAYEHGEQRLRELQDLLNVITEKIQERDGSDNSNANADITVSAVVKAVSDIVEEALRTPKETELSAALREVASDRGGVESERSGEVREDESESNYRCDVDSPREGGYVPLLDDDEAAECTKYIYFLKRKKVLIGGYCMLRGVTALLEAIDERAEQHARQAVRKEERGRIPHPSLEGRSSTQFCAPVCSPSDECAAGVLANLNATDLPSFPESSFPYRRGTTSSIHTAAISASPNAWSNVNVCVPPATTALPTAASGADSVIIKQKEEEIDALTQSVRRYQAAAEVTKQELLQRSLQVHQLEDSLQEMKSKLEEQKMMSHLLLQERQSQYEALRVELENNKETAASHYRNSDQGGECSHSGSATDNWEAGGGKENTKDTIVALREERDCLQAQVELGKREVAECHEQHRVVQQQLEFLRVDLRGLQEALDSEVNAHKQSRTLLHSRQRELNELRAAVEKNGGTFTASGALVALRSDASKEGDVLLSRQLLEKQRAVEAASHEAAEWRRRCERLASRLEEERTARVSIASSHMMEDLHKPSSSMFLSGRGNGGLGEHIWRCISVVDSVTLDVAVVLRRSLPLRIFTAAYIVCLHALIVVVPLMLSA